MYILAGNLDTYVRSKKNHNSEVSDDGYRCSTIETMEIRKLAINPEFQKNNSKFYKNCTDSSCSLFNSRVNVTDTNYICNYFQS